MQCLLGACKWTLNGYVEGNHFTGKERLRSSVTLGSHWPRALQVKGKCSREAQAWKATQSAVDLEDSICSGGHSSSDDFPAATAEQISPSRGLYAAMPEIFPACTERCQKRQFQSLQWRGLPPSTPKCSENLGDWEHSVEIISQRQTDATQWMDILLSDTDSHPSWTLSLRGHL